MEILCFIAIAMADEDPMTHRTDKICDKKAVRGRAAAARLCQLKAGQTRAAESSQSVKEGGYQQGQEQGRLLPVTVLSAVCVSDL